MKVEPFGARILVKRVEAKERTAGGLIIPDGAKEKPQRGEVVAVGEGDFKDGKLTQMRLKVGDQVVFGKYSGLELEVDGVSCLFMKEDDILAVVHE